MTSDRRIAFVCSSSSWGGLEMNVLRLAVWLSERGLRVRLFTRTGTPLATRARSTAVPVEELPAYRKYAALGTARSLAARFRDDGICTAFAFHRDDLDFMAWVKVFSGAGFRLAYQQHMQLGTSRRDPFHTFRYARYDAWISPLEWLRAEVLEKTRVPPDRVRVIPLGVDVGRFSGDAPSRGEAAARFLLPPGGTTFGIIGRIDPGKGHLFLVRCVRDLRDRGHDARLLIAGSPTRGDDPAAGGGYAAELASLVTTLGLTDAVFIRAFVEDPLDFYRAVDACVIATPAETYGMVTLEAMASGTPVIGTASGGTREILEDGALGLLYTPGDAAGFIAKAGTVIAGGYPAGMVEKARARVSEKFSHGRECDLLLDLVSELHGAPPA